MAYLKKSDIIKLLKPVGFIKAVGRTEWREAVQNHRYSSQGMEQVVIYDHSVLSYKISSSVYSIQIEQVHDHNNFETDYLKKICKILDDNGIKYLDNHSYLSIERNQ